MKKITFLIDKYKGMSVKVKASFWFLVCTVMQRGISVLTTPIFTRLLTTGDYGNYGAFNSWLDIVSIFVTLRLYYGVFVQGLVKFEDDRKRYISSMQGLLLVLCFLWACIYTAFRSFWNNLLGLTTVQMYAMLLMIWAAGTWRFWAAEQRNSYRYRMLVVMTLIVSVLKPLLGIILVQRAEDKATARILGLLIAEMAGYTWTFFYHMKKGKQFYSARYWKHALLFNIPLIPHYLSQTVLSGADRIMIRNMVDASAAGIYNLAYSLSRLMSMVMTALTQTLTPWIYQKIKAQRARDIAPVAYSTLVIVAGVNLLLIAFAPEIMVFFAPKNYHNAIWVIPPVAMSVYFQFGYNLFSTFEFYFEKTKLIMLASLMGALLNIALNYVFIQIYGYYAAGYTTLFCYMLYAIGHYVFMRRVCREYLNGEKVYQLKKLLAITAVFLCAGFVLLFTYYNSYVRFGLIISMLLVVFWKRDLIKQYLQRLIVIRKRKTNNCPV